jgi:hypothetical protein
MYFLLLELSMILIMSETASSHNKAGTRKIFLKLNLWI